MQNNTPGAPASSLRTGWEPLPSAVWQEVAPLLPQPWTPGQAAHDLRVYAAQVRLDKRRRVPGRPTLRARWGWSDRQVRKLLINETAWQDPRFKERTATGQSADSYRTDKRPIVGVETSGADSYRTATGQPMSTRADLHNTQPTDHTTPSSPPTGDAVEKAVGAVDKPRRRQGCMTAAQIAAVPVPDVLDALPGWGEAWVDYCAHRQEMRAASRWRTPAQPARLLRKLERDHRAGLAVVDALHTAAASGYQGVFPKPAAPGALTLLDGGAGEAALTADRAYALLSACWGDIHRRQAPHERTGWRLCPDDLRVDAAVLSCMQSVLGTSSTGSAWLAARDLRRGYEAGKFERDFKREFAQHWAAACVEVAS